MELKTKRIISRIICAAVLFFVLVLTLLWNFSLISLPLIGKKEVMEDQTEDPSKNNTDLSGNESIFIRNPTTSDLDMDKLISELTIIPEGTVKPVYDSKLLPNDKPSLPGAGKLAAEGYYTSDVEYNSESFIAAISPTDFTLPNKFSLRNRISQKVTYEQKENYSEYEAVFTDYEEQRPAVEIYMGYIIVDTGEELQIYSSSGNYLTSFDDTNYIPAYTRDVDGNPLFYRIETVESGLFDEEGLSRIKDPEILREPHEKEKTVLIEGKLEKEGEGAPIMEETKVYYRLSNDGSYFLKSTYDDSTEGRGLYFNYPAYFGLPDSNIKLSVKKMDTYTQNLDGILSMKHDTLWAYSRSDIEFTDFKYNRAFNFSEGIGCVITESYYQDGGMFFINSNGNRAFNTINKYVNNMDRYVIDNIVPPLSTGPESIGYFYYDHGLVRARFETIDYWNYVSNNKIKVNSSKEILLDTNGDMYPVPIGFGIKAYSNGMILLEKDGKFGFMNYAGEWIAQPIYPEASPFYEGLAVLKTDDNRYGVIDTFGNIVVPFSYEYISPVSDGIMAAFDSDLGWQIIRKMTAS